MAGLLNWLKTLFGRPPPGTPVFVDVYATGAPGNVSYRHRWRFRGGLKRSGRINIPAKAKGDDGTPIQFTVHDGTRPIVGLRFIDDDNAIWVDRTSCPVTTAASDSEVRQIRPAGTVLRVLDLNEDNCVLHYNLRFEPDPTEYHYDPEIKNGGST